MNERTTVRLPPELLSKVRAKAAAEGRTLTSLIEEGLQHVVAARPSATLPRLLPPVSTVRGGVRPGIDLSNSAALQELEDADYIERLRTGFR